MPIWLCWRTIRDLSKCSYQSGRGLSNDASIPAIAAASSMLMPCPANSLAISTFLFSTVYLNLAVHLPLPGIEFQFVMVMDACEGCGAMIDVVTAVASLHVTPPNYHQHHP